MQRRQRQGVEHNTHVPVSGNSAAGAASSSSSPSYSNATAATQHQAALHHVVPIFLINASLAGVCGALSGVVGKLAVESARVPSFVRVGAASLNLHPQTAETVQFVVPWLLRLICFGLNGVLTGSMWRFYLKALAQGPTPVCQILNTGTNFVVSAFAGLIFFAEEVSPTWGLGAALVVLGLALVVSDPQIST